MKMFAAAAALLIVAAAGLAPAQARTSYVIDNAGLFSPAAIAQIDAKVGDFYAQTHKEVVVDTEPTLTGTPQGAAERVFAQQQINGVLIFIAKSPKTIGVVPDQAAARYFPPGSTAAIRQAIQSAFNNGDFNGGINNGVDLTLAQYRSHLTSLRAPSGATTMGSPAIQNATGGGFNMSLIWWLIALAVIFFVVRGIFRAIAGPRMYPPGHGGGTPMGGPMGGGYGPGYGGGFGGGGGGFWSGMLGGLGGAFLGNELFGGRSGMFNQGPGQMAGFGDGGQVGGGDASGFQSDAGQADLGNASFGGWGGGGDSGGGWGDVGGGGGGDFGGGGDGGGGW